MFIFPLHSYFNKINFKFQAFYIFLANKFLKHKNKLTANYKFIKRNVFQHTKKV